MTANQINYQKYLEDVRSHKANEQVARRQASAAEKQAEASGVQAEAAQMNAASNAANVLINESAVGAQWYGAQANAAYQQAMAAVSQQQANEQARHNKTQESQNLIVEGWKSSNTQYQIQKNAEIEQYKADLQAKTSERNVDVQTREQLTAAVIAAIPGMVKAAPELIRSVGTLIERIT